MLSIGLRARCPDASPNAPRTTCSRLYSVVGCFVPSFHIDIQIYVKFLWLNFKLNVAQAKPHWKLWIVKSTFRNFIDLVNRLHPKTAGRVCKSRSDFRRVCHICFMSGRPLARLRTLLYTNIYNTTVIRSIEQMTTYRNVNNVDLNWLQRTYNLQHILYIFRTKSIRYVSESNSSNSRWHLLAKQKNHI